MDAPQTKITDLPPSPLSSQAAGPDGEGYPGPSLPVRAQEETSSTPKTGPLSADEKSEIRRRHGAGDSNADIARDLGRRIQSVALFVAAQGQKGKPKARTGFQPIGKAARAVVEDAAQAQKDVSPGQPAPAATAAEGQDPEPAAGSTAPAAELPEPVAGSSGKSILGGDGGGLQRDCPAENDPLQAAGVSAAMPSPAAQGPGEDLHGEERRIWLHLEALPMPRGWDVELDLDMAEAFGRGSKAQIVAADLGVDSKQLVERYQQITAVIRDDRGHMTIDGQTAFVRVLRLLVKHRRQQAA